MRGQRIGSTRSGYVAWPRFPVPSHRRVPARPRRGPRSVNTIARFCRGAALLLDTDAPFVDVHHDSDAASLRLAERMAEIAAKALRRE